MNVRELITILADYPPDAEITLVDMSTDFTEGNVQIIDRYGGYYEQLVIIVDAKKRIDDEFLRQGALDQLFDGCRH